MEIDRHPKITRKVSYRRLRPLRIYGGFEWRNERYFRADRRDEEQRLCYYEKRLTAGVQVYLNRQISIDLSAGYAFDRFYFEGKNYGDRDENRLDLKNGPFAAAQVGVLF
ncbi:MAG: hypothetical protein NTY64_05945 [Deltaproteobacteria bacterium]|nr:hypothetical protein [Deltaproteobacteria bacterium]